MREGMSMNILLGKMEMEMGTPKKLETKKKNDYMYVT